MAILFRFGPLIILLPVAVYFYFYFKRSLGFWKVPVKKAWVKVLIAIGCVGLIAMCSSIWNVNLVIIMHWFLMCVLVQLVYAIGKLLLRHKERALRTWRSICVCGLVPIVLTAAVMFFGYWNMRHVVEKDYTVYTEKTICPEGYKLVFISDLHFGISISLEELTDYADAIAAEKPDLVLLGGDIVDESTTKADMEQLFAILGGIPSTYGTYYVYGNHDRARYSADADFTAGDLQLAIQHGGVTILSDKAEVITDDLVLVGREDISQSAFRAPSAQLLTGIDQTNFIVMLDHQPRDLEANCAAGVDLQLSGHTHNGQIWPIGFISGLFKINELTYGHESLESFQVIVSSGMAGWGYPIRTSGRSEYLVLSVKPAL